MNPLYVLVAFTVHSRNVIAAPFQLWRLTVSGNSGMLTCEDGGRRVVFSKIIPYTDFPLPETIVPLMLSRGGKRDMYQAG